MDDENQSVRASTKLGLVLSVMVVVLTKMVSLISQMVLGQLLRKSDFGLYAAASSTASVVMAIRDGGASRLLVQRGSEFGSIYRSTMLFATIVNSIVVAALVAWAFLLRASGGEDLIVGSLLYWIAGTIVVSTPALLGRGLASYSLDFKWIAKVSSATVIVRYGGMIIAAIAGLGALSFVVPLVVSAAVESGLYLYFYFKSRKQLPSIDAGETTLWQIAKSSRWILAGSLASALIINGDYLVMKQFLSKELLGVYFFGFQLSVGLSSIFTGSIQQVLLPAYSRSQSSLATTVVGDARTLICCNVPICTTAAVAVGPAIHFVWGGKWDDAIVVSQSLLLSLTVRMACPLFRAALESTGRWRLQGVLLWGDAIGTVTVSLLVLLSGTRDVGAFAIWISVYRFAFGLIQIFFSSSRLRISHAEAWGVVQPALVSLGVMLSCLLLSRAIGLQANSLQASVLILAVYWIVFFIWCRRDPDYVKLCRKVSSLCVWTR